MLFTAQHSTVGALASPQKHVYKEPRSLAGEDSGWYVTVNVTVVITPELE